METQVAHFRINKNFSAKSDSVIFVPRFPSTFKFHETLLNRFQESLITDLRMDGCTAMHKFK